METRVCYFQCRLDSRNAAAHHQSIRIDRHFYLFERGILENAVTPPETTALAFAVATALFVCTHETCSRIEASSTGKDLTPRSLQPCGMLFSCKCGEHAATTIRVNPNSFISFSINSCPGWST